MAEVLQPDAPSVEPIRLAVTVKRSVGDAFAQFTGRMTAWWPIERFTFGPGRSHEVLMDPFVGGRFFERYTDGEEFTIGEVLAWEPPRLVVFTWRGRWAMPTEVTVRFSAVAPAVTEVQIEHSHWERLGDVGQARRDEYAGGWPAVLAAFVSADRIFEVSEGA